MSEHKWKKFWGDTKEKLQYLKLDEDIDLDDPIQVEERELSSGNIMKIDLPEGDLKEKLEQNRIRRIRRGLIIGVLAAFVIGGFVLYNKLHTFEDYTIVESIENTVSGGTKYESVGKNIYRYNSDGVSCISRENEVNWSITYNMQAPICDVSDTTMAIAEQQGNQVYVIDENGLIGNFEALLPILKVRVSDQGVVAVVLEDEGITWVNLYRPDGTLIADDKTTLDDSGYPLDIDISPDGERLMVSYLCVENGILSSKVVFYNFGDKGEAASNYVVSSETFLETVVPEVYFAGNSCAVAVADNGFYVFRGNSVPKLSYQANFEEEIVSTFHDEEQIGFLFRSSTEGYDYRLEMYNYRAKKEASRDINASFDEIRIQNDQILMYSDRECHVFSLSGRKKFASAYEKDIVELFYFSEYRKYLVITNDSFDRIRIS